MIINLQRFVDRERPLWEELEAQLKRLEEETLRMDLAQALRLHYLYERTSAGLAQISTFSGDPGLSRYVESLVARAYAAQHGSRLEAHGIVIFDEHWERAEADDLAALALDPEAAAAA